MRPVNKRRSKMYFYFACGLVFLITLFGWWRGSAFDFATTSGLLIGIARLTGLVATLSVLLELVLIARIPYMEASFDLEESLELHKLNGYFMLASLSAHVIFSVYGYAYGGHLSLIGQFVNMNQKIDDVFIATLGTIIFFLAVGVSVRVVRKKLPYQIWFLSHLTLYGAIAATYLHQISAGGDLLAQNWFRLFWIILFVGVLGVLAIYRFIWPFYISFKHGLKIESVKSEARDIVSIYISGKDVAKLTFAPGQYASWWFLQKNMWWEGHPYSISSMPNKPYIRLTVKASGDHSSKLGALRKGTRVIMDGPRGAFTSFRTKGDSAVLIAGGVGITPFVPMAAHLLAIGKKVNLFYAARTEEDIAYRDELAELSRLGATVEFFVADRRLTSQHVMDACNPNSTFYICGPDAMSRAFSAEFTVAGIAPSQVISERFAM